MVKIDVYRGTPGKAAVTHDKTREARICTTCPISNTAADGCTIELMLTVPTRGEVTVSAHIRPQAYRGLVDAMLEGAPKEAEDAFLAAMLAFRRKRGDS